MVHNRELNPAAQGRARVHGVRHPRGQRRRLNLEYGIGRARGVEAAMYERIAGEVEELQAQVMSLRIENRRLVEENERLNGLATFLRNKIRELSTSFNQRFQSFFMPSPSSSGSMSP